MANYKEISEALIENGLPIEPLYIEDAVEGGFSVESAVVHTKYRLILGRGDATADEIMEIEKEVCRVEGREYYPPLTDADRVAIRKHIDAECARRGLQYCKNG